MKKVIAFIMTFMMLFTVCPSVMADNENVTVYITVSDISDYDNPLNILVPRQAISVSEFNLANYGDTLEGIRCVEGVTYLHALVQLHRNLYGDSGVMANILLTTDGMTKVFMGKSVANVMYKNGRDIFALPQLVNINNGDEIQVCLYDEGHSQAIATFNEARIDNVSPDEIVNLTLQQHYGFPRDRDPIEGAEITNENGVYITDANGDIITTDSNGNFNVSFDEVGTYTISAMPVINYYMLDTGGGIKVEWIPTTKIREVNKVFHEGENAPEGVSLISTEEARAILRCVWENFEGLNDVDTLILYDWESEKLLWSFGRDSRGIWRSTTILEEYTELVKHETAIPDEVNPMVTYTTPFVTVNVTTDISVDDVSLNGSCLNVSLKNAKYHTQDDVYIAGYNIINDEKQLQEMKQFPTVQDTYSVGFDEKYDVYKIFVWQDGTMRPISEAYEWISIETETYEIDYDFTLPVPWNTYTTQAD